MIRLSENRISHLAHLILDGLWKENLAEFPNERLQWDSAAMKVTNKPEADQFVQHQYRPGWTLTT